MNNNLHRKVQETCELITAFSCGIIFSQGNVLIDNYMDVMVPRRIEIRRDQMPQYNLPETPHETKQRYERRYLA